MMLRCPRVFNYTRALETFFAALVAVIISTAATAMLVAGTTAGFDFSKSSNPRPLIKRHTGDALGVGLVAIVGVYIALSAQAFLTSCY